MRIITAPSKTQSTTPADITSCSQPLFLREAEILIAELKKHTPEQLRSLMQTSEKLNATTLEKIANFETPFSMANSTPAIFTFQGDAYGAIKAETYSKEQLLHCQNSLLILSGLYGILRPLDLMQPYRLEMGAKMAVGRNCNLYQFWKESLTKAVKNMLDSDEDPTLVNLASAEYSKVIDRKKLALPVVDISFKQAHKSGYKTIPIHSKRARGLMIDFVMVNQLRVATDLMEFALDGYRFSRKDSTKTTMVFLQENSR